MVRDFLPSGDAELLSWLNNFYATVTAGQAAEYGLTDAAMAAFQIKLSAYQAAYQTAFEPTTRTRPSINARNVAKKQVALSARKLVKIAQAASVMNDPKRLALKITVPKQRRPVPAPTQRPMLEVATVVGRMVTVNVYDSTSATKRGKPKNCVGAKLYTFVSNDGYPSDPTLWTYVGDYTKTKCEILFPESVAVGAQVYVCAVWYTRTQTGPVCMPVATHLQYGGVQQPTTMKIAA